MDGVKMVQNVQLIGFDVSCLTRCGAEGRASGASKMRLYLDEAVNPLLNVESRCGYGA